MMDICYNTLKKIKCYGVEPSSSVAKISEQKGIRTFIKFFNEKTALHLKKKIYLQI